MTFKGPRQPKLFYDSMNNTSFGLELAQSLQPTLVNNKLTSAIHAFTMSWIDCGNSYGLGMKPSVPNPLQNRAVGLCSSTGFAEHLRPSFLFSAGFAQIIKSNSKSPAEAQKGTEIPDFYRVPNSHCL